MQSLNNTMTIPKFSLLGNISWLGLSEVTIRLTRLLTAVVLGRMLNPHEFGIIAIAMTVQEIVQTMTRNGIGAKIVQTDSEHLNAVSNIVYRINWQVCLVLFLIQCVIAEPVAAYYQDESLSFLLITLAIPYLIYPFSMVQVYLVQRQNRLKITALANGSQVSIDNISSAILALCGFGVWSVVIPKLIVAPLWVWFYRHIHNWRPSRNKTIYSKRDIINFSFHVLGSEICATGRRHIDRLLIGHFLGIDILGIYYFAVNSGLGITLSLTAAFNTAFYPHLCAQKNNQANLRREFKKGVLIIIGLSFLIFGAQAALAPWYVPVIFGNQWNNAVPLLIIITLSGIPRPAAEACGQMLRAIDKPVIEFKWNIWFTAVLTIALYFSMLYDIETVAYTLLVIHAILIPIYVIGCWLMPISKRSLKNTQFMNAFDDTCYQLIIESYPYLKQSTQNNADPLLMQLVKRIEYLQISRANVDIQEI